MTTQQAYNDFLDKLRMVYEEREAANISDWIFENVTGLKRLERSAQKNIELPNDKIEQLKKYTEELLTHKPVQYVLNEAWFYKMKFYVNEHVLIPRPETEELVEWIINDLRNKKYDVQYDECRILDVGSGSGCIPVSLKTELSNLQITSIDISEHTLAVAKRNADSTHTKINFFQINFLDESLWDSLDIYNIIVSNPPYIPQSEKNILAKNVIEFEPGIALFVPDNNPFIFYDKIAKFARWHLAFDGKVYVEIHENYAKEVEQIFLKNNFQTETRKDIYGKERILRAFKRRD